MIPAWLKNNAVYPRLRAGALSFCGSPRFYNPISAIRASPSATEECRERLLAKSIHVLGRENGLTLWETPLGPISTMETESVDHIAFLLAEYGRDVYLRGDVQVATGSTVLDVGANIGLFTRRALRAGAGRVIAVEPAAGNLLALRKNLKEEIQAGTVVVVPNGAWNARATLSFVLDSTHPARSSFVVPPPEESSTTLSIDVVPIDSIVEELGLTHVDFVKMDIEGAELKALEGAARLLRENKPQLAVAVEHTDDWLMNAKMVRELVLTINPAYSCSPGPWIVTRQRRLAPEILYFK